MPTVITNPKDLLLLGLDQVQRHRVEQTPCIHGMSLRVLDSLTMIIERLQPAVVLCTADPSRYRPFISALRRRGARALVFVVGKPAFSAWLDAKDAGAADYCQIDDLTLYFENKWGASGIAN
jgi:hypothetical protein